MTEQAQWIVRNPDGSKYADMTNYMVARSMARTIAGTVHVNHPAIASTPVADFRGTHRD